MIEEEYRANLLLDNLPVRGKWIQRKGKKENGREMGNLPARGERRGSEGECRGRGSWGADHMIYGSVCVSVWDGHMISFFCPAFLSLSLSLSFARSLARSLARLLFRAVCLSSLCLLSSLPDHLIYGAVRVRPCQSAELGRYALGLCV
jgi:hypothetical protein